MLMFCRMRSAAGSPVPPLLSCFPPSWRGGVWVAAVVCRATIAFVIGRVRVVACLVCRDCVCLIVCVCLLL